MSLRQGRIAIQTYWTANWDETAAATVGMSGLPAKVTIDRVPIVRLTIRDGVGRNLSIGRANINQNRVGYFGIMTASIFTDALLGDDGASDICDAVMDLFHGMTLDSAGLPVTTGAQAAFIRFSPPEAHGAENPYVAAVTEMPPLRMTNVVCPFVREELR